MFKGFEQTKESNSNYEAKLNQEFEKIDIVALKLAKKYGEYESLNSFIVYLASMEKVFTRSRVYSSDIMTTKDEIIKMEIHLFSEDTGLDEDMLNGIRSDFSLVYLTISQVYTVAEKLIKKFSDIKGCLEFITSLRDISIIFIEAHENHFTISEIQDRIYRSRMRTLSADGNPDPILLERIYTEFKNELGGKF